MASDTVPAAAPGPNDPASPTTPAGQLTGLAGILAPVQPARTAAFDLEPTTGQDTPADSEATAATGSSDAYHNTENPNGSKNSNGNGKNTKEGVIKTVVRAAAERWRKGADIHIKRLEAQKARHQAVQVKETRQVVANNSGSGLFSPSGKKSASGMGGGKGGSKNAPAGRQTKNAAGGAGGAGAPGSGGSKVPTGNGSGGSGRGPSGGGKTNPGNKDSRHTTSGTVTPGLDTKHDKHDKPSKADKAAKNTGATSNGKGSAGSRGAAGSAGKDGKPGKDTKTAAADTRNDRPWRDRTPKSTTGDTSQSTVQKDNQKDNQKDKAPSGKTGQDNTTSKPTPDPAGGKTDLKKKPHPAPNGQTSDSKTPIRTQAAREAGYRDGARAGRVAGQVRAYRDGVTDGYHDAQADTARDKARLDAARAQRQQQRSEEQTVPTVQPIQVTGLDAHTIHLGTGASRSSIGRGEVRNLVTFLARLDQKVTVMQKAADATRGLQAQAEQQAHEATQLLEQARQVKGGSKVAGALARLADAAQVQAGMAADIHKRALRAAEAAQTVLTNATTRYKPIFQAVVDSPETRPAEMKFYEDRGYQPAAVAA